MDMSKAFDKVNRKILPEDLKQIIDDDELNLLKLFLINVGAFVFKIGLKSFEKTLLLTYGFAFHHLIILLTFPLFPFHCIGSLNQFEAGRSSETDVFFEDLVFIIYITMEKEILSAIEQIRNSKKRPHTENIPCWPLLRRPLLALILASWRY